MGRAARTSSANEDNFTNLGLVDQQGGSRVVDSDGSGEERLDIGAVELAFAETHA